MAIALWLSFKCCPCFRKPKKKHEQGTKAVQTSKKEKLRILTALEPFKASRPQDISIQAGQSVILKRAYSDNWAYGDNLSSGTSGFFPISIFKIDMDQEKDTPSIPQQEDQAKVSPSNSYQVYDINMNDITEPL
jgi:hypothetical protein